MFTKNVAAISVALALMFGASAPGQTNPSRIIADTDTLVPGGAGQTFQTFFQLDGVDPDISGRNVVFMGCCPTGVYGWFNGELRTIADSTTPVPGQPGLVFQNFGQLGGSNPSISGRNVAFVGVWSGGSGIYARIDGVLREIAATGMPAPGSNLNFGPDFGQGNGVRPSISGRTVVFRSGFGIYRHDGLQLQLIVQRGTSAPGSMGTFGGFGVSPVLTGNDMVFGGGFGGGPEGSGEGVFTYINGTIGVIANTVNTPIPGHEDTTFELLRLGDGPDGVRPSISGENVVFFGSATMPVDHHVFGIYGRIIDPPIPATSAWSLVAFACAVLAAGTVLVTRRGRARAVLPTGRWPSGRSHGGLRRWDVHRG